MAKTRRHSKHSKKTMKRSKKSMKKRGGGNGNGAGTSPSNQKSIFKTGKINNGSIPPAPYQPMFPQLHNKKNNKNGMELPPVGFVPPKNNNSFVNSYD